MPLPAPPTTKHHVMCRLDTAEVLSLRAKMRAECLTNESAARSMFVHDTTLRKALRQEPIRTGTADVILSFIR
jgi:predicted DNA-binding protein (UPF0251 family)